MTQKLLLRGVLVVGLLLAVWLGWERVSAPERHGDVPYVPTQTAVVRRMLTLADVDAEDFVFDLGSGDGRIVVRAAREYGARGRGFELDPLLIRESRRNAAAAGVGDRVEFVQGDLFDAALGEATVVTLYLLPTVNLLLRPKLFADLRPGTPVVSHAFDMAEWRPDREEVLAIEPPAELFLWTIPAGVGGVWDISLEKDPTGDDGDVVTPVGGAVLRLLQRFQELEGELTLDSDSVPVTGVVSGHRATIATVRDHPVLGGLRLSGVVEDDRFRGRAARTTSVPPAGVAKRDDAVVARRRAAAMEGVWEVGPVSEPFRAQWALRLRREGGLWTATRWSGNTGEHAADGLPGIPVASTEAGGRETPMRDLYVLGSSVSFFVTAGDGSARRVAYHGLVEGDRIDGVVHDAGALIRWRAVRRAERP